MGADPIFWHRMISTSDPPVIGPTPTFYGSPAPASGKFGHGLNFNTVSKYMYIPSIMSNIRASVSMWMDIHTANDVYATQFFKSGQFAGWTECHLGGGDPFTDLDWSGTAYPGPYDFELGNHDTSYHLLANVSNLKIYDYQLTQADVLWDMNNEGLQGTHANKWIR
jgi:hypothetical protein